MNPSFKYSVQLITSEDQLTKALKLRYRIYKKVFPLLVKDLDQQQHESDKFDERSVHLGLYCEKGREKILAGYCRLVLPQYFSNKFLDVLIQSHGLYPHTCGSKSNEKMASIEKMPEEIQHKINSFCTFLESGEVIYAETSRFIIDEEHHSISLASFFVSSMFAICESLNIKYSFFTCSHHHVPFYKRFGLTLFSGIEPYDNGIYGDQFVVFGTNLEIANAQQNAIKTFRLQLEKENQITFRRAA